MTSSPTTCAPAGAREAATAADAPRRNACHGVLPTLVAERRAAVPPPRQVFHTRIGIHSKKGFVPMKKDAMKEIARNVDVLSAQATFEEDREMILKLARNCSTGAYGKGEAAINKLGRMALYNLML